MVAHTRIFKFWACVLFLQVSHGMRVQHGQKNKTSQTPLIAGIPIYNYHLAHNTSSLLELSTRSNMTLEQARRTTPRRWIVMLGKSSNDTQVHDICVDGSCKLEGHPSEGGVPFIELETSEENLERLLLSEKDKMPVAYVEPDLPTFLEDGMGINSSSIAHENNSIQWGSYFPWGINYVGADLERGRGKGVHVYVVDTGLLTTHADFEGRAIPTLETFSDTVTVCHGSTFCAFDFDGHGTHCAGTVAGKTYGVASGAYVHGVRVFAKDESSGQPVGFNSWTLAAIDWIISSGERPAVISMSLGGKGQSHAYKTAVNQAVAAGIITVVAAGNENDDACKYSPAYISSAITVGAVQENNHRSSFSNYGSCVDIFGPGSRILSTSNQCNSCARYLDGTSMAAPHVSGVVAVLLERSPHATPTKVKSHLIAAAKKDFVILPNGSPNRVLSMRCPDNTIDNGNWCNCKVGTCYEEGKENCHVGEQLYRKSFDKHCASCGCFTEPVPIESSTKWWFCKHPHMHTCGNSCCCDVGYNYDVFNEKCL